MALLNGKQMLYNNHPMHVAISRVSQTLAKENTGLSILSIHKATQGLFPKLPLPHPDGQWPRTYRLSSSSLHFLSDLFKDRSPGMPWRARHLCPLWWTQLWGKGSLDCECPGSPCGAFTEVDDQDQRLSAGHFAACQPPRCLSLSSCFTMAS